MYLTFVEDKARVDPLLLLQIVPIELTWNAKLDMDFLVFVHSFE